MTASLLQLIGTVAAAVAASASLASVLQSRRVIRDAALPAPRAEVAYVDPPGTLTIEVHNAGGGIARAVYLLVAIEGQYVMGPVVNFLRPRESAHLGTDITPAARTSIASGILVWRDASEHICGWSLHGEMARFRAKGDDGVTAAKAWRQFYPDLDLNEMTRARILRRGVLS